MGLSVTTKVRARPQDRDSCSTGMGAGTVERRGEGGSCLSNRSKWERSREAWG